MGGVESALTCKYPTNPDLLSVITLSDSAVQRLPLADEENPLEKEQRNQNTDDYWRDRLRCIDQAHSEQKRLTEKEFARLEHAIQNMAPGRGKILCPVMIEGTMQCYLSYPKEPVNCKDIVDKLELCVNTIIQENSKKRRKDFLRKKKPKC